MEKQHRIFGKSQEEFYMLQCSSPNGWMDLQKTGNLSEAIEARDAFITTTSSYANGRKARSFQIVKRYVIDEVIVRHNANTNIEAEL
jgi:hypothetical protein